MSIDLLQRCNELIERGQKLASMIRNDGGRPSFWFRSTEVPDLQAWIASAANLIRLCATPDTYFADETERVVKDPQLGSGVPFHSVQKLLGLLRSLEEEIKNGLMRKAEYVFVASTFDEFLDHAEEFHRSGKKVEAAVLASTVFEDAVRRLAAKMNMAQSGKPLDSVIDELTKGGTITPVKAKRWKGHAGTRNAALHAQWDLFDIRDVGNLVEGTREIVEML